MDDSKKQPQQISLEIKPEVAKGSYSNLAIITHSHSEFILDFAAILPGMPKPDVTSRIIMTPEHAKRLFRSLQDNIIMYENQFGLIDIDSKPGKGGGTFNLGGFGPFGGGTKS